MLRSLCLVVALALPTLGSGADIVLDIDATDVDHRVFRVVEVIPVQPGRLRLHYPQWIPGFHSPGASRIWGVAGLRMTAAGQNVAWVRDAGDTHTFELDVPARARELRVEFQYLSPLVATQGPIVVASDALTLAWNNVILYPAGVHINAIPVRASVKLRSGWQFASSLDVAEHAGDVINFAPVPLEVLVDSPVFAAQYARKIDLAESGAPVTLNLLAEAPEALAAEADHIAAFRSLVQQSYKLFGAPPYSRYEFLVMLSDNITHPTSIALEHQSSTELPRPSTLFTRWRATPFERPVIAHEFVHAWHGKKHRPAELTPANFNVPTSNVMLWSYEGETEYWAQVLSARSGMLSRGQAMENLARLAASYQNRPGKEWRTLQDTSHEAIMRLDRSRDWVGFQRGTDYYGEGVLLWLEVDARIRMLTGDTRSLDDFAREFHGSARSRQGVVTYGFDDVVNALNAVAPSDWRKFLRERLDGLGHDQASDALRAAGWRVVYRDKPSDYAEAADREAGVADFVYSLGMTVGKQDVITGVAWDSPAFKSGLSAGPTLLAVNGRAYRSELLKTAITSAKTSGEPVTLLIKSGENYRTIPFQVKDGLRYPHLERIPDTRDRLTAILTPLP